MTLKNRNVDKKKHEKKNLVLIADLKSARKTTIETIKTSTRSFRKKNQMGRQHCEPTCIWFQPLFP